MSKKLLSIVIPAYNEESCVQQLASELKSLASENGNYDFEFIIVDNGSVDSTYINLKNINEADPRFKIVRLTRNFTCDGGISAGLSYCQGDAAIITYADLQEPLSLIPQFIEKWEEGYKNVYGIIEKRHDNPIRSFNSKMFYLILNKLTEDVIPKYVGDFRLVDKSIYRVINQMPERNRIIRGLFAWTGASSIGIPYQRSQRHAGESKASTIYTLRFALRAIFSFSYFPLTLITMMGSLLSLGSFFAILVLTFKFFIYGVPFDGFGTIVCLILLLFGFLFIMLGIISKYIAMIFDEVKARPNFIVSEIIGLNSSE